MRSGRGTRQALIAGVALVALGGGLARARDVEIFIPAQPLADTLKDIARQTGENILFTPDSVSGLRAPALNGKLSAQDAVTRALAGSTLQAISDGSGGFIVRRMPSAPSRAVTQDQPVRPISPPTTETVVVTGSRIVQGGIEDVSPVVVMTRPEIRSRGATDVVSLINNLPETFAAQNSNIANGATGTANVNLRGLGVTRSLVLIDGTRLMPGDPLDPVADLNFIPAALVDHVEVLTGGASAVYGSDALAGVVNFIMRRNFEGIELDQTWSVDQNDNANGAWRNLIQQQARQGAFGAALSKEDEWDGAIEDGTFLIGVNTPDGKGNATAYLGYREASAILDTQRDYAACPVQYKGSGLTCQGSSTFNRWLSYDNLFFDEAQGAGVGYDYFECSKPTPSCPQGSKGKFVPFTSAADQLFNFGAVNYLQRPETRYTGGFFAHYEKNRELDIYSTFMFADDYTVAQIAQSGLFLGTGTGPSGTVYVNCSNPLMTANENFALCGQLPGDAFVHDRIFPAGGYWNGSGNVVEYSANCGNNGQVVACNPGAVPGQAQLLIGRRDLEGGYRQTELRHAAYRAQLGVRGDLDEGWSYDLYGQYGTTIFDEQILNELSRTRVQNALQVDPATGRCFTSEQPDGDPSCVPLNIFSGFGSITPSMLRYVRAPALQEGWTHELVASGSLTGDLGTWGGKSPWASDPVGVSLGAEYRQESLAFIPDGEYLTGDLEGNSLIAAVSAAGFNVREMFGEIRLPVVENLPFAEELTLKSGYRYSSYSTVGASATWYGGGEWQPTDDFRLRASMQRAVRAPNVLELFTPHTIQGFTAPYPGGDPCATIVTGQCASVPNAGSSLLNCPTSTCNGQVGGNLHLKPEISNTRSFGIVFTPTFVDGLTATADWWNIDVTRYIATLSPAETLTQCYGPAATPDSIAYFCPFVHRSANGTLYGDGYVAENALNTGYLKTRGIDFEVSYETDMEQWGSNQGTLSLDLLGTWLDELSTEAIPITPLTSSVSAQSRYNCAGLYGTICGVPVPKWRHKLRLTWSSPFDVQVSVAWRYVGAVGLDADTSTQLLGGGPSLASCAGGSFTIAGIGDCPDARISSYSYFDVSAAWDVRPGLELRCGVNNVFAIEPPVLSQSVLPLPLTNGNTFPGTYDSIGRTLFMAATAKF